jgi:hypothetical protein
VQKVKLPPTRVNEQQIQTICHEPKRTRSMPWLMDPLGDLTDKYKYHSEHLGSSQEEPHPTSMLNLRLPQELVDRIVDHLYADVSSLQSCALTSRILYPAAMYHLLHEICLTGPTTKPRLTAFLLKSNTPILYVRAMRIHLGDYQGPLRLIRPWLHATVLSIIIRLHRIKSLTISSMWFNTHDLATMSHRIDQIKVLKLIQCWFDLNTVKFFRSFPHLECLSLSHVDFDSCLVEETLESSVPRPLLKRLIVLNPKGASNTFFDWFVREELHSRIHNFAFSTCENHAVEGLPAFLAAVRPSLLHLDLNIGPELAPLLRSSLRVTLIMFLQTESTQICRYS